LTGEGLKEVAREVGDAFSNALSGEQSPKQAYRAASSKEHTPRPQGSQNASTPSGRQSNPGGRRGA
jgi:hypothetical protein